MKKLYKNLLCIISAAICANSAAQVSSYIFAQSNSTYVAITGGTVVATATANAAPGNLAGTLWNLPSGSFFPFKFNGNVYTGCNISCNGYITFGPTPPVATNGAPISSATTFSGAVSAWGRTNNGAFNLIAASTTNSYTSELRVEELGTAPNRTFVIQYDNWRYSSGTGTTDWLHDFQIRLIETTDVVEIVYGDGVMCGGSLSTSGFNCQVGLRGAANTDFNNRSSFGLFAQSTPGTANNASQVIGLTSGNPIFMPPTGLTYRWHPPCKTGTPLSPTITAMSVLLCEGDSISLGATGPTPFIDINYEWQVSSTPGGPYTNVNGTTFAQYQTIGAPGVYFFVLASTCTSVPSSSISNEIQVDVRPLPILDVIANPVLNTTVSPIETCFGETYTFVAIGASTYTWTNGPTTSTFVDLPFGNPSYTVTGTSIDGCISSKVIDIQVNPLPNIVFNVSPTSPVCPGDPVVIGAGGGALTYTWAAINSTAFLVTVSPTVNTTYTVMATAPNGCTNIAAQSVFVHQVIPVTPMSSDGGTGICKGETATLSVIGADTYTWSGAGALLLGDEISVKPISTTNYTVMGIDTNGCASQASIKLTVLSCVGFNENTGALSKVDVYPNPNNGVFTVELNNGTTKQYEVLDVTGKVVLSETSNNARTELRLDNLAAGVYYLRVQSNSAVEIIKVLKQ